MTRVAHSETRSSLTTWYGYQYVICFEVVYRSGRWAGTGSESPRMVEARPLDPFGAFGSRIEGLRQRDQTSASR